MVAATERYHEYDWACGRLSLHGCKQMSIRHIPKGREAHRLTLGAQHPLDATTRLILAAFFPASLDQDIKIIDNWHSPVWQARVLEAVQHTARMPHVPIATS